MRKQLLSIVLPSYNEQLNVTLIYSKILEYVDFSRFELELIFVNDGSTDDTWNEIVKLFKKDPRVKGLNFSRNFGHAVALEAGINGASGDLILMMDADLQHPPSLIPKLIEASDKGFDIVNTVRVSTQGTGYFKKLSSSLFYRLMNVISDLELREGEADYRLMSRRAVDALRALTETPKFYRGLVNWIGYDVTRIDYEAGQRLHGKSSYSLKKMLELARMGITSFSLKPLKLIFTIGAALSAFALLSLIALIGIKFFINTELVSYSAILIDVVLLVTGIITISQGVIALYLVDIFNTTKGRPTYIVKEKVGIFSE